MNDLVRKLSQGDHPVEMRVHPEKSIKGLKENLARKYVHIRFTDTKGGTELGFNLNEGLSDLKGGDFENQQGHIKVCGDLTLDYEKVRCVADIDLSTFDGRGHLELLDPSSVQ